MDATSRVQLDIVTPTGSVLLDANVDSITLPGTQGEFTVLPNHIPFLTSLQPGVMAITVDNQRKVWAIGRGLAEVGVNNHVVVLTQLSMRAEEIDLAAATTELQQAEEKLKNLTGPLSGEHEILKDDIEWSRARINASKLSQERSSAN